MLLTRIQSEAREWERLIPHLELACTTTSHSSRGPSSFEVMIAEDPFTADRDVVGPLAHILTPSMVKSFLELCGPAQNHFLRVGWHQKLYTDSSRRAVENSVDDNVRLGSKYLPALNGCPKFESRC